MKKDRLWELAWIGVVAAIVSAFATGAKAQDAHSAHRAAPVTAQAAAKAPAMSSGEVRTVDKSAGKITIKHGPLANLDMGPMTMVFGVKDKAMLDQVKAGDKIAFVAESLNGALTVTRLEQAK